MGATERHTLSPSLSPPPPLPLPLLPSPLLWAMYSNVRAVGQLGESDENKTTTRREHTRKTVKG